MARGASAVREVLAVVVGVVPRSTRPEALEVQLGAKHTDCLARGVCLPGSCGSEPEAPSAPAAPGAFVAPAAANVCKPGGGCC